MVPETDAKGFGYLDQLLEALSQLISETEWPDSDQGRFIRLSIADVHEFSSAIREEIEAGRWTVALSLVRPLQERSHYAHAAGIDPAFVNRYRKRAKQLREQDLEDKTTSRLMVEDARGTIRQWVGDSKGEGGPLDVSIALHNSGSELLHHGVFLSFVARHDSDHRRGFLALVCERVLIALMDAVFAIERLGVDDTQAFRCADALIKSSLQAGKGDGETTEPQELSR